ncbi:MAG: hypothetical protein HUJ51_04690, partial [Eggerthellaceae bacterium]|nr:hypothetical protein [Eggerthellaceae bacterium]
MAINVATSLSQYTNDSSLQATVGKLANKLSDAANNMEMGANTFELYANLIKETQGLLGSLQQFVTNVNEQISVLRASVEEQSSRAVVAAQEITQMKSDIDQAIDKAREDLRKIEEDFEKVSPLLSPEVRERVETYIAQTKEGLDKAQSELDNTLVPTAEELISKSQDLNADLNNVLDVLSNVGNSVVDSMSSANSALSNASSEIQAASAKQSSSAAQLKQVSNEINEALNAGDYAKLKQLISSNAESIPQVLSAPITVERHAIFPSGNFGSAMVPLYGTLALFLGAILASLAVRTTLSDKLKAKLKKPKQYQIFIGRFG